MKRVLITGATGFVGANLTRRLLGDGHDIHLLLRPGYQPWRIQEICADVKIYEVNLDDRDTVTSCVAKIRPEWVFHLAVNGAYPAQNDLRKMILINIIGTVNLVEASLKAGFEAFVNTGSSSEYGFKDKAPSEKEWLEPNSYYAFTKASATLFCRYTAQSRKLHIPTLRLYSVYGPYEEPSRLMPTLIIRGLEGKLPLLVSPDTARDYVYVDDVAQAYILAAQRPQQEPGAIYNVGSGIQTSLLQVVQVARKTLEITAEPQWGSMPGRLWDTNVWVADNTKIRDRLGWEPAHSFAQGFCKMAGWFKNKTDMLDFYQHRVTKE